MTPAFAAQFEVERSKGILLSSEENVLRTIRGLLDSLRREGNEVTIESLEKTTTSIGAVCSGRVVQSARAAFELHGVEFRFQHSVAHPNGIEICFISD
jgi:hypothetical protein